MVIQSIGIDSYSLDRFVLMLNSTYTLHQSNTIRKEDGEASEIDTKQAEAKRNPINNQTSPSNRSEQKASVIKYL